MDIYDQTTFKYVNAGFGDELHLFELSHEALLHPEGLTLDLTGRYTTSTPGTAALKQLEFESESLTGSVTLRNPFIRSREFNFFGELTADFRNSESLALGATLTEDKLRSLRMRMILDRANESGPEGTNKVFVDKAVFTVSQGLPILGADNSNPNPSRADGRVNYTKTSAFVQTEQNLGDRLGIADLNPFTLKLAGYGQIAGDALLSAEECGLGGASFGRAFDSSELTGDHCLMGSVKLEMATSIPFSTDVVTPYLFFDGGRIWNEGNFQTDGSLASTGFGIDFELLEYFEGYVEVALPLTRGVASENNSKDPRFFFSLKGEF